MKKPSDNRGVKLRGNCIQISYSYKKERRRNPLLRQPGETDKQSLEYGEAIRNRILAAITIEERGGKPFNEGEFFPNAKKNNRHSSFAKGVITVRSAILEWFEKTNEERGSRTNKKYKREMQEFIDRWGELPIVDITPGKIQLWIEYARAPKPLGMGRSVKTVKNIMGVLRGMFARAHIMRSEWGLSRDWVTPIFYLAPIIKKKKEIAESRRNNEIEPFTLSEMLRIIACATGQYRTFIKFSFGCGARPNEIYGLAWEDIDLIDSVASLQRGWVEGELSDTLKTAGSIRDLPLDKLPLALEALNEQKSYTFMQRPTDHGVLGDLRFVFKNPRHDRPWVDDQEFRKGEWSSILRRACVRYRPPYQMRHTFAVLSLSAGDSEQWLPGVLGHESTKMLQKHYAKNKWDETIAELAKRYGVRGFGAVWEKLQGDKKEIELLRGAA